MTSINHDNNLCPVTLPLPSSTSCHCPHHVPPRELGKKFDKFLNLKITSNNNPTNILTNLCTGLEKFLGFNSDSKGYTGKGIVYSDLDRLCDAVMGFLYGVLSNIQGHLGQHKDAINIAIEALKTNKHAGKKGFNAAIGSVVAGVRGYNGNVKASNEAVIEPLQLLLDYTKKNGGELITSINNIQAESHRLDPQLADAVRSCGDRLKEATERSKRCAEFLDPKANNNTKMKKNIYDLNDKLRDKVLHVRKLVEYESHRLASVHKRKDAELKETTEKIKTSFRNLKSCINKQVGDDIDKLVKSLMVRVQKILKKLREISSDLEKYINELVQWITKVESFIGVEMQKDMNTIMGEMDEKDSYKKPYEINQAAGHINTEAGVLHGAGQNAINAVQEKVKEALTQVKEMDSELKKDLYKVREAIGEQIKNIKGAIGVLYKVVKHGSGADAMQGDERIEQVIEVVQSMIKEIKGPDGGRDFRGLEGIKAKVIGYVANFKMNFWGDIVGPWVDDILGKHDSKDRRQGYLEDYVKQCIDWYIKDDENSGIFKSDKGTMGAIMEEVKDKVKNELGEESNAAGGAITSGISNVSSNPNDQIKLYVESVREGCDTFARRLGDVLHAKVKNIVRHIEKAVVRDDAIPSYSPNLKVAVESTLIAIQSKARQAAITLNSFALDPKFPNKPRTSTAAMIQDALTTASGLYDNIRTALGKPPNAGPGDPKPNHAAAVDNAISEMDTLTNDHIGTTPLAGVGDSGDRISALGSKGFNQYKQQVDQDSIATSVSNLDNLKGALPITIKNIREQVIRELSGIDGAKEAIVHYADVITDRFQKLCAAVNKAGKSLNSHLQFLKNTYFEESKRDYKDARNSIKRIKHQLITLKNENLKDAITEATYFLTSADPTAQATITSIRGVVSSNVEEAQNTLITQVNKNYVTSVKEILTEFAVAVENQLDNLPHAINNDLTTGHKGFMMNMETKFITTVKPMGSIPDEPSSEAESPLRKGTNILKTAFRSFLDALKTQSGFPSDFQKIKASDAALTNLLTTLAASRHFDDKFSTNLDALDNAVTAFKPATYGAAKCPLLLNALKAGFTPLVEELKKAYVSTYSLRTIEWEKLTEAERRNYAKIGLTITPILYQELTTLKHGLEYSGWDGHKIYHPADGTSSLHALFFRDNGYDVHRPEYAEHGELNHRQDFNGSNILKHLNNTTHNLFSQLSSPVTDIPRSASGSDELSVTVAEESGLIRKLYDCLKTYFKVCHLTLIDKPRAPCSIYEILVWCNGLQFNPVYEKLKAQIKSEFMKEDKKRPGTKTLQPFDAHPSRFHHTDVNEYLYKVSSDSHAVLTAILGHGHKDGIYACDFSDNSLKLEYPANMIQLLCTLFDLLKRLYHQLYFLLQQCQLTTQLSGWKDCHYGRYIGGSGWQCNTKQCPKLDCDQRHDQSGNQGVGHYPNCGVKSPLQSFLEDGLKGHLPHSVAARGWSLSCGTCGSTPGMPCRTPMGFADISAIASHTMIGQNIREVLEAYCGSAKSPLTRLCSYLNCLLPSAPKTLADMFSFYYHLTDRWGMYGQTHKQQAFEEKVNAANFGRDYDKLNVYHLFTPSHSALKKGHSDGSLGSLVCSSRDSVVCGPYLRPISHAIYETFSSKHADKYLSWIVYLTATFYDLLKKLYDECNSKCGSRGSNCHGKACIKECTTTSTTYKPPRYHDPKCKSIVKCNATLPTLAKYGFVLGDPERLSGSERSQTKRTCRDFCNVFAEAFEKDSHLVKFFKAIDNFMFTIRAPFLWMTVALWSLSLFYLICVMVGRLDVLHIRSHLRIPSSHKITAQSLLAAAQVGRLAKISYLQP
ncbi:hypothetical protein, conserved [Babesia bigemina]|uniref:C3H1-type domain-containing protein n=1 Tax=Babesia bigemina TaxID=5866 RepID=A0A061BLC2_BABBI|nr:hypothetical protein, conserved [Babesia bigemina]CDR71676.1 hypothetical protein, conserved [Babesia bigemina]|eukprot:XP_012770622.1 hypothetical protein, conserved [Babesia bigemina]